MRTLLAILGAAALLVALAPRPTGAQSRSYVEVPNWGFDSERRAPRYGRAKMSGVAVDAQGRVFAFQRKSPAVLVFDRDGNYLNAWESAKGTPHGCRVDPEGNVWLTYLYRHQVLKYTPDGQLIAAFGTYRRRGRDLTRFNEPADVAFGTNGDVYVADGYGNSRVVRISRDGQVVGAWGTKGREAGQFRLVHSIATDPDGNVYVMDRSNHRIQVFTADGTFLRMWTNTPGHSLFITPNRELVLGSTRMVSVYTLDGTLITRFNGDIKEAHMVTVDEQGAIYVADVGRRRVRKYVPAQ